MQPDFASAVQEVADRTGEELSPEQINEMFHQEYIRLKEPYALRKCHISWDDEEPESNSEVATTITCAIQTPEREFGFTARGNGPLDAFVRGFSHESGLDFIVEEYAEHAIGHSSDSLAIAYIRIVCSDGRFSCGSGIDSNISLASIKAIVSALNRLS
jgi:2-isopropylmalate synthase